MSLQRFSKKRAAAIKSGELRTQGNSSFVMTAQEFREGRTMKAKSVHKGLRKRDKGLAGRSERQKAKDRAWTQVSRFVRMHAANSDGIVACVTCPARKHWKRMQCGHYVTRAKEATLFYEPNLGPQCPNCNRFQGGKPVEYELYIDLKYGEGMAAEIRRMSLMPCRRTIEDYERIEAEYRERVQQLLKEKPWITL